MNRIPIEQLNLSEQKYEKIINKLKQHLNEEGRIVYGKNKVGSHIAELISSIYAKEKRTKLIDEDYFKDFVKKLGIEI